MTDRWAPGRLSRGSAVVLLALATLIAVAPAAAAHVAVDSARPNGDGTTTVTLTWNHSCSPASVTTGVDVAAGDGVSFTGASTDIAGWTAAVDPDSVIFTGPGVPTGEQVSVAVEARISGTPGSTITFPAIQHCRDQQTDLRSDWTDPDPAADHPAPSLIATAAVLTPTTTTAAAVAAAAEPPSGADITAVLTGIVVLAAALGTIGFLGHRRTDRR
jgi:uncharacterized protein YcnI